MQNTPGRSDRSHPAPRPDLREYEERHRHLLPTCREGHERRLPGRIKTVGEMCAEEAGLLLPLPDQPFPTAEVGDGGVDSKGLVYTSDAADDLLCVDLGGRRIIKKKK